MWRVYIASHIYPLTPLMGQIWVIKYGLTFTSSLSAAGFSFQKPFFLLLYYTASNLLGSFVFVRKYFSSLFKQTHPLLTLDNNIQLHVLQCLHILSF